nr:hypothetical protein [Nocardia arizonensis]
MSPTSPVATPRREQHGEPVEFVAVEFGGAQGQRIHGAFGAREAADHDQGRQFGAEVFQHRALAVCEQHRQVLDHDRVRGVFGEYAQLADLDRRQPDAIAVRHGPNRRDDIARRRAHPQTALQCGVDGQVAVDLRCAGAGGAALYGELGGPAGLLLSLRRHRYARRPRTDVGPEAGDALPSDQRQGDQSAVIPAVGPREHALEQFAVVARRRSGAGSTERRPLRSRFPPADDRIQRFIGNRDARAFHGLPNYSLMRDRDPLMWKREIRRDGYPRQKKIPSRAHGQFISDASPLRRGDQSVI